MSDTRAAPPVFQIGFNRCGTKFLSEIFRLNGYRAEHWRGGSLAEDILVSKCLGRQPLMKWSSASFFSDLECCHRPEKPLIEAFKEFRFLQSWYQDAYFILNLRRPDEWVASRIAHHNGRYIEFHARYLDVTTDEVPEIWMTDWHEHIGSVRRHFKNSHQLIEFDIDSDDPKALANRLAPHYHLFQFPESQNFQRARRRKKSLREKDINVMERPQRPKTVQAAFPSATIHELVEHCLATEAPAQPTQSLPYSGLFGHWRGGASVLKLNGEPWGLVRCKVGRFDAFLADNQHPKISRLQGVLNECLRLKRDAVISVDMQDARKFGENGVPNPDRRVLTYNRRQSSKNTVLWPLPGYHDIGLPTFVASETSDTIAFEQKRDVVVWRGNLAGRAGPRDGRSSFQILADLQSPNQSGPGEVELATELEQIPRFQFMLRHYLSPDFNLAFTLPGKFQDLTRQEKLGMFCGPRKPISWFHQFRYIACLSGYDTGSNFFVAANSNSVIMKEEDGWELFYTSLFRPWEHYIPIAVGGTDAVEKLEWARSRPAECRQMSRASRDVCRLLADQAARHKLLNGILDGVTAAI